MGLPRTVSASDYHDDAYKFSDYTSYKWKTKRTLFSAKLKIYRATFK